MTVSPQKVLGSPAGEVDRWAPFPKNPTNTCACRAPLVAKSALEPAGELNPARPPALLRNFAEFRSRPEIMGTMRVVGLADRQVPAIQ
jgi:hypothetical protein